MNLGIQGKGCCQNNIRLEHLRENPFEIVGLTPWLVICASSRLCYLNPIDGQHNITALICISVISLIFIPWVEMWDTLLGITPISEYETLEKGEQSINLCLTSTVPSAGGHAEVEGGGKELGRVPIWHLAAAVYHSEQIFTNLTSNGKCTASA